jgi:hypothetical protein
MALPATNAERLPISEVTRKYSADAPLRSPGRTRSINMLNRPGSLMYWRDMYAAYQTAATPP